MSVTVHGLTELETRLRAAAVEMPIAAKAVSEASAAKVAEATSATARAMGSTPAEVIESGGISSAGTKVTLNTGLVPFARGAEFGSHFPQFKPPNPSGYFFTPTVKRLTPEIVAAYLAAVIRLLGGTIG